ncbi:hypothetical protein HS7_20510 [Sulfolobales archaeon HS-7]|nr:hypothetical protein HS7_20510 [Sulfolobales archaeon HS-7]
MLTIKQVLDRIIRVAEMRGYNVEAYDNHLIIYGDEFKTDVTVIDDNVIMIQSRGYPKDRIDIVKAFEIVNKNDKELIDLLNL